MTIRNRRKKKFQRVEDLLIASLVLKKRMKRTAKRVRRSMMTMTMTMVLFNPSLKVRWAQKVAHLLTRTFMLLQST